MSNEVDRQVETRPPIDIEQCLREANGMINGLMVVCETPPVVNVRLANEVIDAARPLVAAIVTALPEGNERIIALNGIKGALLWVKDAIMSRGPVEVVSKDQIVGG